MYNKYMINIYLNNYFNFRILKMHTKEKYGIIFNYLCKTRGKNASFIRKSGWIYFNSRL